MGYQSKRKRRRKRRRRGDDELTTTAPVAVKDPVDDVQSALKNPALMKNPDTILAMQSVIGNQAVQRALKANEDAQRKKSEDLTQKKRDLKIERYKTMSLMMDAIFPEDVMVLMLQMFKEMGYDPQKEYLLEIQQGKFPQYLPTGEDSVFTLDEEQADKTGQQYFLGDEVGIDLVRLQMILMMVMPDDVQLQNIISNPVITVTGMDNSLLGVSGLENSSEIDNITQLNNAHIDELPAIARFLTEDQAKLLMDIDPEMFRIMIQDILPEQEVEDIIRALTVFLKNLKTIVIRGSVMKRPEWDEARRRGMLDKDSSSFDQVLLSLNNLPH
jgi:hypothetical protein